MTLLERLRRAAEEPLSLAPLAPPSPPSAPEPLTLKGIVATRNVEGSVRDRPLPAPQKPGGGCGGCKGSWWKHAVDFGHGTFDVVRYAAQMAAGIKAPEEVQASRQKACRACPLFTSVGEGIYSCGVPATKKVFRIRSKDGCGCWLNLKWLGKDEKCPLEQPKW